MKSSPESIALLAQATELMSNTTDYEATFDCIARLLVSSLASWCTIDLVTDDGKIERVSVAHRDPSKVELTTQMLCYYPADPKAKRGVYQVIATGKSVLIPEVSAEVWTQRADDAEHLRLILELGSSSYMCVPLMARGRVVGAIMILSGERSFDLEDLNTAEELARCIAMAVDNVHMFRKMQTTLQELEATQAKLIQSAKLAGLGVLSAGIAHEINNPLAIVCSNIKIIELLLKKQNFPIQDKLSLSFSKIERSIDRIVKIVSSVKDFSHQARREMGKVELNHVVRSSLNLVEPQLKGLNVEVLTKLPERPVYILGEIPRLEQVFVNVFMNAFDAIKEKRGKRKGKLSVQLKMSKYLAQVKVSDNGVGIDPEIIDRVFEPFFTTKDVGAGIGLGLSISHGIINDHGGSIDFVSRKGNGTNVIIELPLLSRLSVR